MNKILVVIDMQNDFIDGPLGTPEARAIVPKVCDKIREGRWDYIYLTKDTHFYNYLITQEGKKLPIEHCIAGTTGHLYNSDIIKAIKDSTCNFKPFIKTGFACKGLCETILCKLQCQYEVNEEDVEITLVGVCTDICVISNALLLKTYFPEMKIVVDASCCAGTTPNMHGKALDVMWSCQIDILNDSESVGLSN